MKLLIGILVLILALALIYALVRASTSHRFSIGTSEERSALDQAPQRSEGAVGKQQVDSPTTRAALQSQPTTTQNNVIKKIPTTLPQAVLKYPKAPELVSPDGYLNTGGAPITLAQYRGKKVVLLEFWTYSCINCKRTLPYITSWYEKYKSQGLVVVGVHTPEFAFEHLQSNVAKALQENAITYPVVLDNEYKTWNTYNNRFWPHQYLIDGDGNIIHEQIGEGGYLEMEEAIQKALQKQSERSST